MLFDKLLNCIESLVTQTEDMRGLLTPFPNKRIGLVDDAKVLLRYAKDAKLFVFDGDPRDVMPEFMSDEEVEFNKTKFILPFDVVAIEDYASCVLIANHTLSQKGTTDYRAFLEIQRADPYPLLTGEARANGIKVLCNVFGIKHIEDAFLLTYGVIKKDERQEMSKGYQAGIDWVILLEKDKILHFTAGKNIEPNTMPAEQANSSAGNAWTALREIMYFNSPDRHILEVSHSKPHHISPNRIPRSHQRPQYILLHPHEIKRRMGLALSEDDEKAVRAPHERRSHYRRLSSERYTHKQGQVVIVRKAWVGPSESIVGKRKYRVLVDR